MRRNKVMGKIVSAIAKRRKATAERNNKANDRRSLRKGSKSKTGRRVAHGIASGGASELVRTLKTKTGRRVAHGIASGGLSEAVRTLKTKTGRRVAKGIASGGVSEAVRTLKTKTGKRVAKGLASGGASEVVRGIKKLFGKKKKRRAADPVRKAYGQTIKDVRAKGRAGAKEHKGHGHKEESQTIRKETTAKAKEMRKGMPKYSSARARAASKKKRDDRHEATHLKQGKKAFKKGGFAEFGKVTGEHHRRHPVKKD